RDREHARAATDIEEARRLELLEQLEAEPGRRVRARAEGAARIDRDRRDAGRRLLPRRPDPEAADDDAVVEVAPRVLPPLRDGRRGCALEPLAQGALPSLVGVDGVALVQLLHPVREQVEQQRELALAAGEDDSPDQRRKTPLSFSNRPSSARYGATCEWDSNSASRRRCSSVRWRGTTTLTRLRWSPRPKPCSTGMPRPRKTTICPGCVPGASSSSSSPSRVGMVTVSPRAACVIVRSTVEK